MLIKTKRGFYDLAAKGLCGNTPQTWTYDDFVKLRNRPARVTLRSLQPQGQCLHNIASREAVLRGHSGCVVSRIPDLKEDNKRGLQGELSHINGDWYLYYTTGLGVMRQQLALSGEHAYGYRVLNLLRSHCTAADYSDIMDLFDKYTVDGQYPVIEFTMLPRGTGHIPGRHTVIWEIRHY